MAIIVGVQAGLRAESVKKAPKTEKIKRPPDEKICSVCGGVIERSKRRSIYVGEEGECFFCDNFFGAGGLMGVTDVSPKDALKRMAELREHQWGIILRTGRFAESSGLAIEVGCGDIFKIARAGAEGRMQEREFCSRTRTMELFATHINVGPVDLTLWPHEIAAISFVTVMQLRKAGEIEESFVAAEDEQGYFKPTIEIPWR